jgi:hypothetical protein
MRPLIRLRGWGTGSGGVNGAKKKTQRIKKEFKLDSGIFIAISEFEEVKRHREVCDA